jgi:hypothetical protein
MKPGFSSKQRVKILTVDPSSRRIEGALKDGAMIQIAVWEVPTMFRWPQINEYWTVYRENGYWMLGSKMDGIDPDVPQQIETLQPGEGKVAADVLFTPSGRRVMLDRDFGQFNVKHYGAVGDGVTDDTKALLAAVSAANDFGEQFGAADVFLPGGVYLTSQTLLLHNKCNIIGQGNRLSTLKLKDNSPAGTHVIANNNGDNTPNFYNQFRNFGIDGNRTNNPSGGDGIHGFFNQAQWSSLTIQQCGGTGLRIAAVVGDSDGPTTLNRIEHVTSTSSNGEGCYLTYAADFFITDCWFGGHSSGAALRLDTCANGFIENVLCDDSTYGIQSDWTDNVKISNFTMDNNSTNGMLFARSCQRLHLSNGVITVGSAALNTGNAIKINPNGSGATIGPVTIQGIDVYPTSATTYANILQVSTGGDSYVRLRVDELSVDPASFSNASPLTIPTAALTETRIACAVRATVSVASASTVTLPADGEIITVTGTTTITTISPSYSGRRVTLVFAGIVTVTDGSNLRLAGNFVTTSDDALSLICDGTNWYEVSRSVN